VTTLKPEVLYPADVIAARIQEMGATIGKEFGGQEVCVVGLIKSCMVFMADLIRAMPNDMTCHFLRMSSLREGSGGSMRTDIVYSTEVVYEGRHILLLDDIVDTGITLNFLLDHIRERRPKSLKVAALIDKPGDRKVEVDVDWAAFTMKEPIGDRFLVGYGLDYNEHYRSLPYIATIPREGRATTSPVGSPGGPRK
jgi:hypoxanthine phosphoribosyltransferase